MGIVPTKNAGRRRDKVVIGNVVIGNVVIDNVVIDNVIRCLINKLLRPARSLPTYTCTPTHLHMQAYSPTHTSLLTYTYKPTHLHIQRFSCAFPLKFCAAGL
jgi:hypothetical protein